MATRFTLLAPGQRYVETGFPDWRTERQLTIVFVLPDLEGVLRVAARRPNGDRTVDPAAHFEAAVAAGKLHPVVGFGRLARC